VQRLPRDFGQGHGASRSDTGMLLASPIAAADQRKGAAVASIGVALATMGLKYLAYAASGSVALYSDALESVVNLITAAVALYTIHVSAQPADRRHQFGHHKAEYFSAVLEGVLIVVAALLILREAYDALMRVSISGLMDEAVTAEVLRLIRHVIATNAEGAIEAHDVKTRTAGRATFIEFHLVVPGTMTVATSHRICDRIEQALQAAVRDAEVLIHVEPEEEAKAAGVPVV